VSDDPRLPVLIVLHQEASSPGRIGQILERRGHRLDIRRPRFGDPLPRTLAGHAGAVIFGGPMSANDDEEWIRREIDWIGVPLKEEKPFLGVCLGAQMMVRHLGGRVESHPRGDLEVGWFQLKPTGEGRALMTRWPTAVYQWHREGFQVPADARLLATGEGFPHQAIGVGRRAYGIQFHPEVTLAMMHRWTVRALDRMIGPGVQSRRQHFDGHDQHDRQMRLWAERFLDLWLDPNAAARG
jgi:GMP synthase (glutamine-hydrolysing)